MDLEQKPWANIATVPILELLYDVKDLNLPLRGADIQYFLQLRIDHNPPSDATVYRALDNLVQNGYIESVDENRYRISEDGVNLYEEYSDA